MTSPHNLNPTEFTTSPQSSEVLNPALVDALSMAWSSQPEVEPPREALTPNEIIAAFSGMIERMRSVESTDTAETVLDEAEHARLMAEILRSDDFSQVG